MLEIGNKRRDFVTVFLIKRPKQKSKKKHIDHEAVYDNPQPHLVSIIETLVY